MALQRWLLHGMALPWWALLDMVLQQALRGKVLCCMALRSLHVAVLHDFAVTARCCVAWDCKQQGLHGVALQQDFDAVAGKAAAGGCWLVPGAVREEERPGKALALPARSARAAPSLAQARAKFGPAQSCQPATEMMANAALRDQALLDSAVFTSFTTDTMSR